MQNQEEPRAGSLPVQPARGARSFATLSLVLGAMWWLNNALAVLSSLFFVHFFVHFALEGGGGVKVSGVGKVLAGFIISCFTCLPLLAVIVGRYACYKVRKYPELAGHRNRARAGLYHGYFILVAAILLSLAICNTFFSGMNADVMRTGGG